MMLMDDSGTMTTTMTAACEIRNDFVKFDLSLYTHVYTPSIHGDDDE